MTNFPVSPDISAVSTVMYNEGAVLAQWGQNFTQDQLMPSAYDNVEREYVYVSPTSFVIADWNDEATNGFQAAEWLNAWTLFVAYYENVLIPNKIVLLQVFDWRVEGYHTGTKFQPRITFKFLPFSK